MSHVRFPMVYQCEKIKSPDEEIAQNQKNKNQFDFGKFYSGGFLFHTDIYTSSRSDNIIFRIILLPNESYPLNEV